jgi:hypothetical protein
MPGPIGRNKGRLRANDSALAVPFDQKRNGLSTDLGDGSTSETHGLGQAGGAKDARASSLRE